MRLEKASKSSELMQSARTSSSKAGRHSSRRMRGRGGRSTAMSSKLPASLSSPGRSSDLPKTPSTKSLTAKRKQTPRAAALFSSATVKMTCCSSPACISPATRMSATRSTASPTSCDMQSSLTVARSSLRTLAGSEGGLEGFCGVEGGFCGEDLQALASPLTPESDPKARGPGRLPPEGVEFERRAIAWPWDSLGVDLEGAPREPVATDQPPSLAPPVFARCRPGCPPLMPPAGVGGADLPWVCHSPPPRFAPAPAPAPPPLPPRC
mmetsp:Transcript_74058/g.160152  ORF Transcript_74058/g.160152 Transcript_74058/m.160152 type:complete len:266 (+) Transcript_74058:217-1014(+)